MICVISGDYITAYQDGQGGWWPLYKEHTQFRSHSDLVDAIAELGGLRPAEFIESLVMEGILEEYPVIAARWPKTTGLLLKLARERNPGCDPVEMLEYLKARLGA